MKVRNKLILTVVCLVIALSGIGCISQEHESPKSPPIPSYHLLLSEGMLPTGWATDSCEPTCDESNGTWQATRSFYYRGGSGHIIQEVRWYESEETAVEAFRDHLEVDFRKSHRLPSSEFRTPDNLLYRSKVLNEYLVACGIDVVSICRALMQYDGYLISFYVTTDEGDASTGITIRQLDCILENWESHFIQAMGIYNTSYKDPNNMVDLGVPASPTIPSSVSGSSPLLDSPDYEVRISALRALIANQEENTDIVVSELVQGLQDPVPDVRLVAIAGLRNKHYGMQDPVSGLVQILATDPSYVVRYSAAEALGEIGNLTTVPYLAQSLSDPEIAVQRHSAEAIIKLLKSSKSLAGSVIPHHGSLDGVVDDVSKWWLAEGQYLDWSRLE